MSSGADAANVLAALNALASTARVDSTDTPRVDFVFGGFPPLPDTTVPALGADQKATVAALRAAGLKPDQDTNATSRQVTDAVVNGTTTVTSATASFVAGDAGARITLEGCGVAGADLVTRIASVTNGTTVVLDTAATASGTGKVARIKKVANAQTPAAAAAARLGQTVVLG